MRTKKDEFKLPYRISHSRGMTKFEAEVLASAYDAVALGTESDGDILRLEGTGILDKEISSFVIIFRPKWMGDRVTVGWPRQAEVLKRYKNPGLDTPSAQILLTILCCARTETTKAEAVKMQPGMSIRVKYWEPKFLCAVVGVLLMNGHAPHRGTDAVLHAFYGKGGLVNPGVAQQAEATSRALRKNKELTRFFCNELTEAVL